MTATPRFDVRQNEEFVFVDINVPYVRVSDMEFYVDDCDFTFYCKPYLLKLTFPAAVVDDERAKAVYDLSVDHGTITVSLPKKNKNEDFPNLDLLTTLLQRKRWKPEDSGLPSLDTQKTSKRAPLIEVLSSTVNENDDPVMETEDLRIKEKNNDSSLLDVEKTMPQDETPSLRSTSVVKYGFQNKFSNFFNAWQGEISEIIALPNPDTTLPSDRAILRHEAECKDFDEDRYLADLLYINDDFIYQEAIRFVPHWENASFKDNLDCTTSMTLPPTKRFPLGTIPETEIACEMEKMNLDQHAKRAKPQIEFLEEERSILRELPNKEYLIENGSSEEHKILYSMVDILVA